MSAEGKEIGIERLNVDGNVRRGLRAVDDDHRTDRMSFVGNLFDVIF